METLTEEEWDQLARKVALNPANHNSVRQTKELLKEGLVEEYLVRHKVRYCTDIQPIASKYYSHYHSMTYRRMQAEGPFITRKILGPSDWARIDEEDRNAK